MAFGARDMKCPYIFQRDGERIRSFRTAFENARERLGLSKSLFHDLHRTAVRKLGRAGVRRSEARQISGHHAESVYPRFAIGAERDAIEVGSECTAFMRRSGRAPSIIGNLWGKGLELVRMRGLEPPRSFPH